MADGKPEKKMKLYCKQCFGSQPHTYQGAQNDYHVYRCNHCHSHQKVLKDHLKDKRDK